MDKMDKEDQIRLAEVIKARSQLQSQKVSKTALPKLA